MYRVDQFSFIFTILSAGLVILFPTILQYSDIIFLTVLVLVGIPHGAIDDLIQKKQKGDVFNRYRFYSVYVALIGLVFVCWFYFPKISFLSFLIISAYHFGQSQIFYFTRSGGLDRILWTAWGGVLFSAIIYFNYKETSIIFESFEWIESSTWMTETLWMILLLFSFVVVLAGFLYHFFNRKLTGKVFLFELTVLGLLVFIAYVGDAIIALSVYFGVWHSFRSMVLEYQALEVSFSSFIKHLLPFTTLALIGMASIYYLTSQIFEDISPYMAFIILISALTIPHLLVMDFLYKTCYR